MLRLVLVGPWLPLLCALALLVGLVIAPGAVSGQTRKQPPEHYVDRGEARPGEILVSAESPRHLVLALGRVGLSAEATSIGAVRRMRVPVGQERARATSLAAELGIIAAPNYIRRAAVTPTDPYFSIQGYLETISAPAAWNVTTGSANISIAIIDSGIDLTHPELQSKISESVNLLDADPGALSDCPVNLTARDDLGHGTHVAGIAAAASSNGAGISGVAWQSPLLIAKALNCYGVGTDVQIIAGIDWAIGQRAKIINLSVGGPGQSDVLDSAIARATASGAIVVVASGNLRTSTLWYPASSPGAVSVSATDSADRLAGFSNYGSRIAIAAPGQDIFSTFPVDRRDWQVAKGYQYKSGTSMSAPIVAGGMALVWSAYPSYSASRIIGIVEASADRVATCPTFVSTCPYDAENRNDYYGHGRINLQRAMNLVRATHLPLIPHQSAT